MRPRPPTNFLPETLKVRVEAAERVDTRFVQRPGFGSTWRVASRESRFGVLTRGHPERSRETAMTRCRDRIIERSRWICSVVLMSALGAGVFGVAGAGARDSSWAVTHQAPTHVHASTGFSSHVIAA